MKYLLTVLSLITVVGLVIQLVPNNAQAETVVRTGDIVTINSDQTVEEDFYAGGNSVTMSGVVKGDMYVVGGSITLNGSIESDLAALGGVTQVHASVTDDVRVVGGEVVIAEEVGGDVFVVGGTLTILSSASIAGDLFVFGGSVIIDGPVQGSIMGSVEQLRLNSSIGGDVDVVAWGNFTIGEQAIIEGNVSYESHVDLVRAQAAVIKGDVIKTAPTYTSSVSPQEILAPLFMLVFGVLSLYLFFRSDLEKISDSTLSYYGRSGLIGIAVFILVPIVVLVLMISVLGLLVGLVMFTLYLGLQLVSLLLVPVHVGSAVWKLSKQTPRVTLISILVGSVISFLVIFIPFLGPLLIALLYFVSLGGVSYWFYELARKSN